MDIGTKLDKAKDIVVKVHARRAERRTATAEELHEDMKEIFEANGLLLDCFLALKKQAMLRRTEETRVS